MSNFINFVLSAIVEHVPSLAFDYDAVAAPLAVAPAHPVPEDADVIVPAGYADGSCPVERAIRARDFAAIVASL